MMCRGRVKNRWARGGSYGNAIVEHLYIVCAVVLMALAVGTGILFFSEVVIRTIDKEAWQFPNTIEKPLGS